MSPEGIFLDYIDFSYQFGILRTSTFCLFKWFFTKANRFYKILTNASELFCANNFLQKSYFSKKFFLLNHTSWVYFLDYMSLPYHFGKLWMSTFHWFQLFFTKAKRIHTILTNTSKLFFGPDLSSEFFGTPQDP